MEKNINSKLNQIDDYNRQILKLMIERNRFLSEENLNDAGIIPEYVLDSNAKFISVNNKLVELLGYSSSEELMDAIAEGKYIILKSDLQHLLSDNDFYIDRPLYLRTKTGSYQSLLESVVKEKKNGTVRYYGLIRHREKYGRVNQDDAVFWASVNQIFGGMKQGIVVYGMDGMIVYGNLAMRRILGYGENDELPSQYVSSYVHKNYCGKVNAELDKLFRTEKQMQNIACTLLGNGHAVKVNLYSYLMKFGDHKFCVSVVMHDEGSRDTHTNKEASLVSRDAFNIMSELYILISPEGDIRDINTAAVNMWGWDYGVYLTKTIFDLGTFSVPDMKRNIGLLCENLGVAEYQFVANNTIWGQQLFMARMIPVHSADGIRIAVVMDNRREILQLKDNLNEAYRNNLALFENTLCGMMLLRNKEIVKINKRAYSLLKINYDIRGEQISEILKDTRRRKRHIVTTPSGRKEEAFEYEVVSEDRRTLLDVHLFDLDKDNVLCYFTELIHRKSVQVPLRDAATRYKAIVEQSPCGVLIGDKNGDIIDVSDRFCDIIKMSPSEILGKNISVLFTSNSIVGKPLDYTRVNAGEIISAERDIKCGDGTIKVVEMYSSRISNDMYQAVILDITSRKIYETQMLDYRKKMREMDIQKAHFMKMSKDLSVVFNANAEIKDVFVGESSPFYKYFSSEKEIIERFINYISQKDNDTIIRHGVARAVARIDGKAQNVELMLGGHMLILEVRFMPIEQDVLMVVSDVTERECMIRELNAALKKSEEDEKLKTAFLSNLSHELRTPMNGVIGFADLMFENEDNPEKREYLKIILDSSYQLLNVLSDIIEMSKLESGSVVIKQEIVDVKKVINDVCVSMRTDRMAVENNVQLINHAQERKESLIVSDNVKLRQIITNLIDNAIKFTKDGKVEVDFANHDENICIMVRDTGVGISKEDIGYIFNRFYQTKNAELATRGAGLGLAIVKSYVDMLQGTIRVESEVGEGSCFYVELPSRY